MMPADRLRALAALVLAAVLGTAAPAAEDAPLWRDALDPSLFEAGAAARPIVLLFSIPGCGWCDRMLQESEETPAVRQALAQTEPVHLDAQEHPALAARLALRGFPTTVLVNRRGEVVRIVPGYVPPRDFATMVRSLVLRGDELGTGRMLSPRADISALAARDDAPQQLVALLGQGDPEQRRLVRELLGALPEARDRLWQALDDPSLGVRVDAAAALAQQLQGPGGYDPFAPADERRALAAAWRAASPASATAPAPAQQDVP